MRVDVLSATCACTLTFVHKSQNDFYFIDRNGRYFEPILDYLRSGDWTCPTGFDEKKLLAVCLYNLLLNIFSSTVLSLLLLCCPILSVCSFAVLTLQHFPVTHTPHTPHTRSHRKPDFMASNQICTRLSLISH